MNQKQIAVAANPIPDFKTLEEHSLSTKKDRKHYFCAFVAPPKAPTRSCPVPRTFSVFKDDHPRPVSFRDDSDITFITDSPIYSTNIGTTYFEQCYTTEKLLGRGSFGEVFKVCSKETGMSYACKRTLLKYRGESDRARRIQEVKKHEQLPHHQNCVRFYRAWEEDNHLYLLTEVCQSSLADIINDNHEFVESQIWSYLVDILQGLHHLHKNYLMHMDVKPENIFIGIDGLCKLGDFGLVVDFSKGYPKETVEGDPKYLAPECLQNNYSPAADIFSLGMVILEIATDLYLPQRGPLWHELRSGTLPLVGRKGLSLELESMLKGLLDPNPTTRFTSSTALDFKNVRSVVFKKNVQYFIMNKALAVKHFLEPCLVWPMVLLSYFISILKRNSYIFNQDSDTKFDQDNFDISHNEPLKKYDCVDSVGDLPSNFSHEVSNNFCLPKPLINSTPISYFKKRDLMLHNHSKSNSEQDVSEGSKFVFNESSFSSLESSRDDIRHQQSEMEDGMPSLNMTSRNLLGLFNTLESDDD